MQTSSIPNDVIRLYLIITSPKTLLAVSSSSKHITSLFTTRVTQQHRQRLLIPISIRERGHTLYGAWHSYTITPNGKKDGIEYKDLFAFDLPRRLYLSNIIRWHQGERHGYEESFTMTGAPFEHNWWQCGKREGISRTYYSDGSWDSVSYMKGAKHGICQIYNANGTLANAYEWKGGLMIKRHM